MEAIRAVALKISMVVSAKRIFTMEVDEEEERKMYRSRQDMDTGTHKGKMKRL